MVNINKLKGKIVERGMNVGSVAKAIGINHATLYRKLNADGENISIKEACLIGKTLKLSVTEMNEIFFAQFVA